MPLAAGMLHTLQHTELASLNDTNSGKPHLHDDQLITELAEWHHHNIPEVNDNTNSYTS